MHSAITSLVVFHPFLHENEHYRAITNKKPDSLAAPPTMVIEGDDIEDEDEDDVKSTDDWALNFGPISEVELMAGLVVKDRILQMLDHPKLKNHLLKQRNLLPLIVRSA